MQTWGLRWLRQEPKEKTTWLSPELDKIVPREPETDRKQFNIIKDSSAKNQEQRAFLRMELRKHPQDSQGKGRSPGMTSSAVEWGHRNVRRQTCGHGPAVVGQAGMRASLRFRLTEKDIGVPFFSHLSCGYPKR